MMSDAQLAQTWRPITGLRPPACPLAELPGSATTVLPPEAVLKLRGRLPAITRRHLFDLYGISETTWTKLRDGKPVKASTLIRILERYDRLVTRDAGGLRPDAAKTQDGTPLASAPGCGMT
jgi:hypothetical protein